MLAEKICCRVRQQNGTLSRDTDRDVILAYTEPFTYESKR